METNLDRRGFLASTLLLSVASAAHPDLWGKPPGVQKPSRDAANQPVDVEAVLGKVNYSRARGLTIALQQTLRNIKSYQQIILTTDDRAKRQELERLLDEEIGRGVAQTMDLLSFLREYGFDRIVFENKEELIKGFSRDSIPPYEKQIFLNAGFTEQDFQEFVNFFATDGYKVLTRMEKEGGLEVVQRNLEKHSASDKGSRYRKIGSYLKIVGGSIAAGGDVLVGILVGAAIPPAGVATIVASTGAGIAYIGDGVSKLGEEK